MTPRHRRLVVGRVECGYSFRQLALLERLSPPDAARMALRRALALAVVLYEMVAGEHPFAGDDADGVTLRIRRRRVRPAGRPSDVAAQAAAAFAPAVLSAPRRDRPATAPAFAAALRSAVADEA